MERGEAKPQLAASVTPNYTPASSSQRSHKCAADADFQGAVAEDHVVVAIITSSGRQAGATASR
ncbi:MAG: hypothetical protein C0P62_007625, partial [Bacillota bacterium]